MTNWLLRHVQVLLFCLGQMARAPVATLMSVAVLAIALALPAGLYVLVGNLERIAHGIDASPRISAFLSTDSDETAHRAVARQAEDLAHAAGVVYVSPAEAAAEFRAHSGLGDALDMLPDNPLPGVLLVTPLAEDPESVAALAEAVAALPHVEAVQVDMDWVRRLHAIVDLAERAAWLVGGLLAVAVLVIIGNTIRLAIYNRRREIEIVSLVGGTTAFVRRPFLYSGALHGVAGAMAAWILVNLGLALLDTPVSELASLYGDPFRLRGLDFTAGTTLVAVGGGLGWLAARVTVGRHLARIHAGEPLE